MVYKGYFCIKCDILGLNQANCPYCKFFIEKTLQFDTIENKHKVSSLIK